MRYYQNTNYNVPTSMKSSNNIIVEEHRCKENHVSFGVKLLGNGALKQNKTKKATRKVHRNIE
jgi:hypothetical protein